jgi:hypothetical protein
VSIKKFPLNDDSPSSSFPGRTEVLYGNENIQRRVLETFSRVNERLDGCTDPTAIVVNVRFDAMWNGFVQIERKGVRLRAITEVTPENISSEENNGTFRRKTSKRNQEQFCHIG